ncbi:LysE family translocator [Tibeticola sp.]|uniref:LysE family translocator n=1 Tax=Tibeticola sp. TaxID=2005368 RepID=UPI0025D93942|nr:LysE family translocator [Tibeticola sp.]
MPDAHHLLLFVAAGLLLNLTPGPDVLYIATHGLRQGFRAGAAAALGVAAGCFVHILAAAAGVSALLATSAQAFTVLKLAGAAYLLWVGLRLLRHPVGIDMKTIAKDDRLTLGYQAKSSREVFSGGFWTNALNPKVALFFLAFVPQFVAPESSDKALHFVLLGLLFNFNGLLINLGWAGAAAWMRRGLARTGARLARLTRGLDRAAGAMFVAFGVKLALTDRPTA